MSEQTKVEGTGTGVFGVVRAGSCLVVVLLLLIAGSPEPSLAILGPDEMAAYCEKNPNAQLCGGTGQPQSPPPPPSSPPGQPPVTKLPPKGLPTEVWLADLAVSLTANKDLKNQVIVYQMTVTNLGDDDGREIAFSLAFSHSLPPGLKVLNVNSRDALCGVYEPTPGLPFVKCTQSTLPVRGTSTVAVAVANPGNGPRKATAQVMGIVPDYNGTNNTITLMTP